MRSPACSRRNRRYARFQAMKIRLGEYSQGGQSVTSEPEADPGSVAEIHSPGADGAGYAYAPSDRDVERNDGTNIMDCEAPVDVAAFTAIQLEVAAVTPPQVAVAALQLVQDRNLQVAMTPPQVAVAALLQLAEKLQVAVSPSTQVALVILTSVVGVLFQVDFTHEAEWPFYVFLDATLAALFLSAVLLAISFKNSWAGYFNIPLLVSMDAISAGVAIISYIFFKWVQHMSYALASLHMSFLVAFVILTMLASYYFSSAMGGVVDDHNGQGGTASARLMPQLCSMPVSCRT